MCSSPAELRGYAAAARGTKGLLEILSTKRFPNTHRQHEAFAAGFGHALGRLLSLPLLLTLHGVPGDPALRTLARAALTHMRHGDLVLQFRTTQEDQPASAMVQIGARCIGPITDPDALSPALATM